MKKTYAFKTLLLAIALLTQISFVLYAQQSVSTEQLMQNHQNQVGFEENKGQVTGEDAYKVKYFYSADGVSIFLLNDGLSYIFTKVHYPEGYDITSKGDSAEEVEQINKLNKETRIETYRMDVQFVGANLNSKITTEGKSQDYIQYYNHDVLNVHNYTKITYHDVYPNIDWVIYKTDTKIKYDFVVHPGGDPNQIQLKTSWVEDLKVNADGGITLKNRMGEVTEENPISFQNDKAIKTQFQLLEEGIITFQIEQYNPDQTLVIDPALQWGTYYGGNDVDQATSCATDALGNVYLAGTTGSTTDIASGGHQNTYGGGSRDGFLVKFNSLGVRTWATYFGGGGFETGHSCAVDGLGNVYLAGRTEGIPTTPGAHQPTHGGATIDAYIAKFNSSGVLQWATHYGGSNNDEAPSCAVDNNNNVYLAGWTKSAGNISSGGHQNSISASTDAFLVKFDPNGVRLWGTYYGDAYSDKANSCATDALGNVYLAGTTESTSNIAAGGHQFTHGGNEDAFLVKFNSAGVRIWSTYYGGSGNDWGLSCVADSNDNVYLAGATQSTNNMASGGHQNTYGGGTFDGFLVKFSSSTGVREWGTYYGGTGTYPNGNDQGYSCTIDGSGNVYLAGETNSNNNISSGGHQNTYGGLYDAFLVKFNTSGLRQWATYYGGTGDDKGFSCAVDLNGDVYLAGETVSNNNIAFNGHDIFYGGGGLDGFLAKFNGIACSVPTLPSTITGSTTLCEGTIETYSVTNDAAATSYTWTLPSGWSGSSTTNSITATAGASGGTITVTANNACGSSTTQTLTVTVNPLPTVVATGAATICDGDATTLTATGASSYTWDNGAGTGASVSVSPTATTTYTVTGTDANSCSNTAQVTVTVNPLPTVVATGTATICDGDATTLNATGASSYAWDNGAGSGASVSVSPTSTTTYTVTGTDANSCSNTAQVTVTVNPLPSVVATGTATICDGDATTLTATGASSYAWNNGAGTGASVSVSPTSTTTYTVTGTDANSCSNTAQVTVTVNPLPTVVATGSATICNGDATTLTATGASSYTWDNGAGTGTSVSVSPTATTTYTVTGTDANSCSNTAQVTVTVNPLPTVVYTQTPNIVCENDAPFALTGGSPSGGVYSGTGVGSGSFDPALAGAGTHTITYSFTDGNNCSNTDTQQIQVDVCAGIDEQANQLVTIYPNPFKNEFTVSFTTSGNHTIELFNVLGEQIKLINVYEQNTVINTDDLPSGVYFLRIVDEKLIFKLLKN